MASSLKISRTSEIYDTSKTSSKTSFLLNSELRLSRKHVSSLSFCVLISGTSNVKPFTRVKYSRVCSLSTGSVGVNESNNNRHRDVNRNVVRRNERDIWKKLSSAGVKRTSHKELFYVPGVKKKKKQQREPSFENNGDVDSELEAALAMISPDSSIEECNALLKKFERFNEDKALSFFEWMRNNGKLEENAIAYNVVLKVLGRRGDWVEAEKLVRELITSSGHLLSFHVFNTLIYVCNKRGLVDLGAKWFRLMLENGVQPNLDTVAMLMSLYRKSASLVEAEFVFQTMRRFKLKCQPAYSAMISIYTRFSLYANSEEVMELMKEDEVIPNKANWLVQINAYSQQGKLEEAERVLISMHESGIIPDIVAYNILITGYVKISNMDAAQSLFLKFRDLGLKPDEMTYRTMIEGWGREGNYKETEWYYRTLKQEGFKPNSSNLYMMLNLQAKNKDDEGVIRTLDDMRRMGCQYSSVLSILLQAYEKVRRVDKVPLVLRGSFYNHVLVDQTSCSILVIAYVKHQLVDDALQVLKEKQWKDTIFEDNLYHLLICSCKESGRYNDAVTIFTQMPKSNNKPNLHILCTMIDIYGIMDQFDEAKNLYSEIKSSGVALDMVTYSAVIKMFLKFKSLEDACMVLDEMEKQKGIIPDRILFVDMLQIYEKCGMQKKLEETYYEIMKSRIVLDQETYNFVIKCCARALPVDELSRVFDEMLQHGYSPNNVTVIIMLDVYGEAKNIFSKLRSAGITLDMVTCIAIIKMLVKSKSIKAACSVLDEMEKQKDITPDTAMFQDMLFIYEKCGMQKKLEETYYLILKSRIPWDQEMYNCIIKYCARALPVDELSRVFDEMLQCGYSPNNITVNIMLDVYGKANLFRKAGKLFWMARKMRLTDAISYNTIISAYGKSKKYRRMRSAVRRMQFHGYSVSLEAYTCMLDAYGKEGDIETFRSVLEMLQESSCIYDHYTYNTLINIYGEQGWIEEVAEVLTELKESGLGPDLYTYNTLIKAYGIAGMVEKAVDVVKEMRENGIEPDLYSYNSLIKAYTIAGMVEKAIDVVKEMRGNGIEPDRITFIHVINALERSDNYLESVKWSLWMKQLGIPSSKS